MVNVLLLSVQSPPAVWWAPAASTFASCCTCCIIVILIKVCLQDKSWTTISFLLANNPGSWSNSSALVANAAAAPAAPAASISDSFGELHEFPAASEVVVPQLLLLPLEKLMMFSCLLRSSWSCAARRLWLLTVSTTISRLRKEVSWSIWASSRSFSSSSG